MSNTIPSVLFLGSGYAGHRARFLNLKAHTQDDPRIRPAYRLVSGWQAGGFIERLPLLPSGLKGRLRAVAESAPFARMPRPDIIWTSAREALLPHLWAQAGPLRRPLVLDLDWTLEQQEHWALQYYGRRPRTGWRWHLSRWQERLLWNQVSLFTPWSEWAASSLRRQGIEDSRIRVIPPGVDLGFWQSRRAQTESNEGPLRLLFVGGDFVRKGGDMLLDVLRSGFPGRFELDIVTRAEVPAAPGVRVHHAEANSPQLRDLYARADLFVLPSRAECFGIATLEAMASGLPVLISAVGGAGELVDPGETGWLIEPAARSLAQALEQALAARDSLPGMGARARAAAEARFDESVNARRVVDTLLEVQALARDEVAPPAVAQQRKTP